LLSANSVLVYLIPAICSIYVYAFIIDVVPTGALTKADHDWEFTFPRLGNQCPHDKTRKMLKIQTIYCTSEVTIKMQTDLALTN